MIYGAFKKAIFEPSKLGSDPVGKLQSNLTSETVQGASLALKSVDNVHRGDGLPLGVLAVGDCVTDHVLQEHFQDTTGLLVDQTADALHTTSASQTADGGLGDSLDVVTQDLAMTLGSSLSQSLASFATSGHC